MSVQEAGAGQAWHGIVCGTRKRNSVPRVGDPALIAERFMRRMGTKG